MIPRQRLADYRELTRRIDALDLASPGSLPTVAFCPSSAAGDRERDADARRSPDDQCGSRKPARRFSRQVADHRHRLAGGDLGRSWQSPRAADRRASAIWYRRAASRSCSTARTSTSGNRSRASWSQAKNEEGALVLQGRGLVRRSIFGARRRGRAAAAGALSADARRRSARGIGRRSSVRPRCRQPRSTMSARADRSQGQHARPAGPMRQARLRRRSRTAPIRAQRRGAARRRNRAAKPGMVGAGRWRIAGQRRLSCTPRRPRNFACWPKGICLVFGFYA